MERVAAVFGPAGLPIVAAQDCTFKTTCKQLSRGKYGWMPERPQPSAETGFPRSKLSSDVSDISCSGSLCSWVSHEIVCSSAARSGSQPATWPGSQMFIARIREAPIPGS